MFYLFMPLAMLLLVIFQHTVLTALTLNLIFLEFSLAMVVYAGFRLGIVKGAMTTIVLGFFMDCIVGTVTGYYMFIYYIIFCFSFVVSPLIYTEGGWAVGVCVFLAGCIEVALLILMTYGIYGANVVFDLPGGFVPQLVVVSFLGPLVFHVLDRLPVRFSRI